MRKHAKDAKIMEFVKLKINGLVLIKPKVFEDERGWFFERWRQDEFAKNGLTVDFVQENSSRSQKGVLRGLHFQAPPRAQDKLVWVTKGEAFDVAVDIRRGSPTFGQWESVMLSEESQQAFFIPKGFAHAFLALSDQVDFHYQVSDYYAPETDGGLRWDDPDLGIGWPLPKPIVSAKDQKNSFLKDLESPFTL